jgi:hypothetical protein
MINHYYCRGCGGPLPPGRSRHFHPECLKADKQRRTSEGRERVRKALLAHVAKLKCPECGFALAGGAWSSDPTKKSISEASQKGYRAPTIVLGEPQELPCEPVLRRHPYRDLTAR